LERIVAKALTKDCEERYQTAKDLLIDLRRLKKRLEVKAEIELTASTNKNAAAQTEIINAQPTDATHALSSAEYIASGIKQHRRGFVVAALAMALLAAVGFGYWFFAPRSSNTTSVESIAVLPFVNASGNADVEYLSDGMTETLINSLSQLPKLNVKARSSVFRYKGKEVEPRTVAAELSVQAILTGRVVQRGDDLALYLSLVDARNGNHLWGEGYNRKLADLVSLQKEIACDVSQKLRVRLSGADEQRLARNYTENVEAYQLYLKGRYHYFKLTQPEIRKGISFYEQAIDADPSYALAYAGMADAYRTLPLAGWNVPSKEAFPQAKAAARRALEIDENLAEAHIVLGWVGFLYDWDWTAAESELVKAIELSPNNSDAHRAYAHLLSNSGRHDGAIAEGRRARELDPLSLITNTLEGQFLFYAGHNEEAIARLRKTLEIEPNFWIAHNILGRVYIRQRRYTEATAALNRASELSGGSIEPVTQLGYALARSGKREQAEAMLEELKSLAAENHVPAYSFAMVYNGLGERDEALKHLEKSSQEREVQITFIKVDTRWDELRADPRFQDLLRRMNLN
nr:tetratricopeptide repeat protein [Pyrinomonadaceae bacterium]